jgi:hypothetical protein
MYRGASGILKRSEFGASQGVVARKIDIGSQPGAVEFISPGDIIIEG